MNIVARVQIRVGKSTLLRALVPATAWFSDSPIVIGEKDGLVALRGRWIIELSELASLITRLR